MTALDTAQPDPGEALFRGGRRAAESRLAAIEPARYGASRNHLDGAVTRLSPWIRHGVLTLAEVREAVFQRLQALEVAPAVIQGDLFTQAGPLGPGGGIPTGSTPGSGAASRCWSPKQRRAGEKLISELGWRDYWQRLWLQLGDGIWQEREPLKTGHPVDRYSPDLPADVAAAATGLACIDGFATELIETGWLHNHARLWLASYLVHWRRVRWQAGARWFLRHLLDGDPASNNLSWQWVASSFSHKPYIFNRANLERFSSGRFCASCPAAGRGGAGAAGGCPFEASYEWLQERLFRPSPWPGQDAPAGEPTSADGLSAGLMASESPDATATGLGGPTGRGEAEPPRSGPQGRPRHPLVWVHEEALGPANPALCAHPGAPALAVLDAAWLEGRCGSSGAGPASATASASFPGGPPAREGPPAAGRLRFLRECLAELPVTMREGDVVAELMAAAAALGADAIVTSRPVDPRLRRIATRLAEVMPVQQLEPEPFVALPFAGAGAPDLRRFSRYWRRAEPLVWGG